MTKVLLFTASIFICLLVAGVHCDEEEGEGKGKENGWSNLWKLIKEAFQDTIDNVKKLWDDMTQEIKARTADVREWTQEMWSSFKQNMKEWVNTKSDADEKEKENMRNFIEKLKMPEGNHER